MLVRISSLINSGRVFAFPRAAMLAFAVAFASALNPVSVARADEKVAERCFENLDFLNGIVRETTCAAKDAGYENVGRIWPFKRAPKPVEWSIAFKQEGDLHRYLECYATEDGRYDAIAKKYMPLIETAAKDFDVPKTVLACLLFRESRFDMNATSPTGAIGLGQMLPSTMVHMTNLVKKTDPTFIEKMRGILGGAKSASTKEQAVKDRIYAKTILKNNEFTESWEKYIGGLKKTYYKKFNASECARRNPKSEKDRNTCVKRMAKDEHRTISTDVIKTDPAIAIGSSALYLKTILAHFHSTLKNAKVQNGDTQNPDADVVLAAAGAYNMGPGAAAEILASFKNPKKWPDALAKSNEETAAHILSIKNCITPPAKSKIAWDAPIGSANHNCDASESGKPKVLPGGANDLPKAYQNKAKTASFSTTPLTPVKKQDKPKSEPKKKDDPIMAEKKKKERQT